MSQVFSPGTRVVVRTGNPEGHCRTPTYLRGQPGVVRRHLGSFRNPEQLAYGKDGMPEKKLYQVIFTQNQLWPDYQGAPGDTLTADIYEHWLDSAE